jgi:energy-coupling factor transporter ATP-binding protein EcfA2
MSFKLLAIRPLEGCRESFLKNLDINRFYKFYNDYEFFSNDIKIDDFEKDYSGFKNEATNIKFTQTIPNNFFGPKINISAIVGKNGSGKSSLVELLYAAFFNLSIEKGFIKKDERNFKINDINLEVFILLENSIYKIIFSSKNTVIEKFEKQNSYFIKKNSTKNYLNDLFTKNSLFYNIVINYSLYGLNSKEVGDWVESIFHKNDGYKTPIVLNPMRTEGNFDINVETELAKQRFIANLVYNKNLLSIGHDKKIISLEIELREISHEYFYIDNLYYDEPEIFLENKFFKYFFHYKKNQLLIEKNKQINNLSIQYIFKKIEKIVNQYDDYKDYNFYYNENTNSYVCDNFDGLLKKINSDNSHITLKLKQTINFLFFNNFKNSKKDIIFENYFEKNTFINNTFEIFYNEINYKIKKFNSYFLDPNNCQAIYFLPPPIFKTDFILEGNYSLSKLSSGERQRIYSLNSILYHLLNLNSVHYNENAKYKYENLNIILDEIELYYHPEMQIEYIKDLIDNVNKFNLDRIKNLNFIFVTHSPFILSDIPKQNVLFLEMNDYKKAIPINYNKQNTFAGNISELLEDSFFLKKGLIGNFAKEKIEQTINWLIDCETKKSNNFDNDFYIEDSEKEYHLKVIELIDEKIIHYKLREKYFELFPKKFEEEEKEKNLKKLAKELGYKIERLK